MIEKKEEKKQEKLERILIEAQLFDDFLIAIYDKDDNLMLDKKYFVHTAEMAEKQAETLARIKYLPVYVMHKHLEQLSWVITLNADLDPHNYPDII